MAEIRMAGQDHGPGPTGKKRPRPGLVGGDLAGHADSLGAFAASLLRMGGA